MVKKSHFHLNNFKNDCVFTEHTKDVQDAHHDPRFDRRQALRLWSVGRHRVEDVDEDKKKGDQ